MFFAFLTLLSALTLASVAGWFSIVGIVSIYAGAPMHAALVMGIVLEIAKLVTVSWVYRNWVTAGWKLRAPMIYAILALMLATSISVFGFLTKSHLEQGAATVDNTAKVERLDQQIAREKSVIADDEKVISQLDNTINSYLGKDNADRAVVIRRSQAAQRKQLRADIDVSHKKIDGYSDEKFKLQSEVRALKLEVGPIRYISELFYSGGDETKNIESAVKLFTLLIVSTLDPLAVILLIAANHTLLRLQNEKEKPDLSESNIIPEPGPTVAPVPITLAEDAPQDISTPANTPSPTKIQKVIDEEEDTALAKFSRYGATDVEQPLPIIRQPSPSKVEARISGVDTEETPAEIRDTVSVVEPNELPVVEKSVVNKPGRAYPTALSWLSEFKKDRYGRN